jgi:hypothetical protein
MLGRYTTGLLRLKEDYLEGFKFFVYRAAFLAPGIR